MFLDDSPLYVNAVSCQSDSAGAINSSLEAKETNDAEPGNRVKKLKLLEDSPEETHFKLKPAEGKTSPQPAQTLRQLLSMDDEPWPATTVSASGAEDGDDEGEEEEGEEEAAVVEELQSNRTEEPLAKSKSFSGQLCKQKDLAPTSQCPINGEIVEQVTYFDTWYVIRHTLVPVDTRQQRHYLKLPLVKLANAANHMKLPTANWSSKVTLYKVAPAVLQRHTLTIYTGDLKVHKIPERERHKYQPSCVIFRRELSPEEHHKCHVPFDRVVIFKHNQFSVNFDGKLVNLAGAPEAVTSLQDVQKLLDIVDSISLSHSMVEIVMSK
ncbi:uncharacterized protein Dmoj_GI18079 [Drosophila mojavensis]|uniref:Uncharacterized protein n=1 Tax=Drosophila mojavensis TaxID=7230 RepID=B4KG51_DROMO|nr:uncharacterized protein Dmoj_GI18079 [Drosophila mojavensis]